MGKLVAVLALQVLFDVLAVKSPPCAAEAKRYQLPAKPFAGGECYLNVQPGLWVAERTYLNTTSTNPAAIRK